MPARIALCFAAWTGTSLAMGQAAPPASQSAPAATAPAAQEPVHWAQRVGMRSAQVTVAVKIIDRVVLVPDAATYIDELKKWSPRGAGGRWPVLIEDDVLTPMFVRRFRPAELIRRESVNAPWPQDLAQRRQLLESVVVGALGGNPAEQSIRQVFDLAKYAPPGVVVASTSDPAWTAAVALAAGHAQPLIWIDDDYGPVSSVLDDAAARKLAGQIDSALAALPWSFKTLGDDIDAITLCRNLPGAANLRLPDEQRLITEGQHADGTISLSDFLGRNADHSRFAFTGWIFGDEKRCAYMAMCSLFLSHDSAALLNAYGDDGEWGRYTMDGAAELFTQTGFAVQTHKDEEAMGEAGWRRLLVGGLSSDVVWMNSGGNDDYFILNGGQARPGDVPILNQPAAVHLIHSWSLKSPARSDTVGGRWLEHGAYAMVGSCFEPFLATFVSPLALATRCLGGAPFLAAARHWPDDPRAKPWRIVTIGDPLMLIPPVGSLKPHRVKQPADYGENLLDRAKTLMHRADSENDANACAEAIRLLDMLGQDDIALQMWTLAHERHMVGGTTASAALNPLFRMRDAEGFMRAWSEGGPRNPLQFDMLWHLMMPRLGGTGGAGTILREDLRQLEAAIRPDMPSVDVERLAPNLLRVFGEEHLTTFLRREIDRAKDPEQQRQLRAIAGKY